MSTFSLWTHRPLRPLRGPAFSCRPRCRWPQGSSLSLASEAILRGPVLRGRPQGPRPQGSSSEVVLRGPVLRGRPQRSSSGALPLAFVLAVAGQHLLAGGGVAGQRRTSGVHRPEEQRAELERNIQKQ